MSAPDFYSSVASLQNTLKMYSVKFTKDDQESKDLIQETMLKALNNKDKFKENTNMKAWLFTIMRNTYINQYNSKARKSNVVVEDDEDMVRMSSVSRTNNTAEMNFALNDISSALNTLRPDFREVFQMFVDGYKYQEIADEKSMALGTVKSVIFLSRKALMKKLKAYAPA